MPETAFFCPSCDAFVARRTETTAARRQSWGSPNPPPTSGLNTPPTAGPLASIETVIGGPSAPNGDGNVLPTAGWHTSHRRRRARRIWRGFGELVAILAATVLFAAGTVAVRFVTEESKRSEAAHEVELERLGLVPAQWSTGACVHGDPVGFPEGDTGRSASRLVAVQCSPPKTSLQIVIRVAPGTACPMESSIVLVHDGRQYCATRDDAMPKLQA